MAPQQISEALKQKHQLHDIHIKPAAKEGFTRHRLGSIRLEEMQVSRVGREQGGRFRAY